MRKLLLSITVVLLCGLASAEENLVKNPGFEEALTSHGKPGSGWWLYEARGTPRLDADRGVAHQGKASARIHATDEAKCTLVSAPFPVAPGDELRFQVWVRGENLPAGAKRSYGGLAYRNAEGKVFDRAYISSEAVTGDWMLISGAIVAPAGAVSAEVHLGYTNAPGTLWFDDASAVITSPVSFSLVESAKPWPGEQEISLLVVNRAAQRFQGSVRAVIGRKEQTVPVMLEAGASKQVKVPVAFTSVGAHNYDISLLDTAGKPLRTIGGKFHTRPALVLYPACPCYHAAGEGNGETRIDGRINLNPAQRRGLRLAVGVTDASGKGIQAASCDASTGDIVGLKVRVPVQSAGKFEISARLVDGAGKELAAATTDVHVAPAELSRVTTGPDGFLRIAGKPSFPIGMYSCGHYEEMGQAGFTGTHNYGITTGDADDLINLNEAEVKALLDKSWANGMRMMVELPRKAIEKARWEQISRRVETFRYHPGLLCWGSEERVARGEAPLSHIVTLYALVHKLDPNHPFVLGDTKDVIRKLLTDRRDFFPDPCMDAGIWWWYPIPLHAPDGNGLDGREKPTGLLQPPSWLTTTISKKPLWIAIQSYQHPRKDARYPTPTEYRCMAYLSIINGVKALWFYTGSGQRDWQGKPAGLLNRPADSHWDYVQTLVGELREFSPVVMAPACSGKVTVSPPDAPVEFATRELDGKLYVISANKSDRAQSVRFTGSALMGKRATVLYETHSVAVEGDSLKDDFTPFGVHVYKVE